MDNKSRIIESSKLTVKLLNGTELEIRPLTLSERKECLKLLPEDMTKDPEKFVDVYVKVQGDIIHYIVSRINEKFPRKDIDTQFDSSMIEQIITFTLKDPFMELM